MSKHKKRKKVYFFLLPILFIMILFGFITRKPKGISYEGSEKNDSNVQFLYDLTYQKNGQASQEQEIFKEQLKIIEEAEELIILDLFLFNDDYNRDTDVEYPNLSQQLTEKLIEKKKEIPEIQILFITDEINNFYGVYQSDYIKALKENDIDVVITDLEALTDSNPVYSGIWRSAVKWFGTAGSSWLPNPFSPDSPKVTIRGYLKLINFKANHRKVIVSEKNAILTSMNPHDASGNHSNIGFKVEGSILNDIIEAELAIAKFSGYENINNFKDIHIEKASIDNESTSKLITEGKIRDALLEEIRDTREGHKIQLSMFYLSHRGVVGELIQAVDRGVELKMVLDPNKDAFGIKKNGIPNRQVAHEIQKKTGNSDLVRWYDTHGEQFHTKMVRIEKDDHSIIIGGSANFTRRNLNDLNLESDLLIETKKDSALDQEIDQYFQRIWTNEDAHYTVDYEFFEDTSTMKTMIYRFQEWSGLSSF